MGDSRKRRQSGAAQLTPVLDAKDDTKTRSMVSAQRSQAGRRAMTFALRFPTVSFRFLGRRWISQRKVAARTTFARANCRWPTAMATGLPGMKCSLHSNCEKTARLKSFSESGCLWMEPLHATFSLSCCVRKGRAACHCSRSATRRTSPWRSRSPTQEGTTRTRPPCWPPSRARSPTPLSALCQM